MAVVSGACQVARYEPTPANPSGDCRSTPVVAALPLGDTGRHLALCAGCAPRFPSAIPPSEVPDP